jgi:hypothetical protein
MASAGLLKLLHSGLQDERLLPSKGVLKMQDFQKVYVKGGRFTTEWYTAEFDNSPAFSQTAKCTIPRRGHLITRAFLMVKLPDIRTAQLAAQAEAVANGQTFLGPTFGWTNSVGHALVNSAQVTIGGNAIDTIDGRLMEVLDEFHTPLEKVTVVNRMIGRHDSGFSPTSNGWDTPNQELAIPLPFWFARGDPSEALPIDAISSDNVQISVTFNNLQNLITSSQQVFTTEGGVTYPTISKSVFYFSDASGSLVQGLGGDPHTSSLASTLNTTMPEAQISGRCGGGGTTETPTTPGSGGNPGPVGPGGGGGGGGGSGLQIVSASILLEYVYLDGPEANRIRLGDLTYPIVQHYNTTFDTGGRPNVRIPFRIPNPTKEMYFYVHRQDADLLNAPFLATRDLKGITGNAPWWPDATGLNTHVFSPIVPAYSDIDSEPLLDMALTYEGKMVRYATDVPAIFQSILPAYEQRKTPWHNKYYYHIPFGTQGEEFGISNPMGHANLDKIINIDLSLTFKPVRGSLRSTDIPSYTVYVWSETYNILRVYGGRAGLLFGY